jgi:hypothetical protein
MKSLAIILIAFLMSGCGPFMAGHWTDNPKSWQRYFKEPQPASLVVRHSYYERSPQPIFLEFACFIEIEDSKAARAYLGFGETINRTSLKISDETDAFALGDERAPWFPTRSTVGDFEIWRPADSSMYVVIVDIARSRIFITDRM